MPVALRCDRHARRGLVGTASGTNTMQVAPDPWAMDCQTVRDHPSFRTALATVVAGTLLLAAIFLVVFVVPYLVLAGT